MTNSNNKILVTGGAGYIGSHTVSELIKQGHEVIVYDNLVYGHRKNVDKKARFVPGDINDTKKLSDLMHETKPDAVIHFAAFAYVGESVQNPAKYYSNNVSAGINLLECMNKNDIKNIVFSSSCAIFGQPQNIPISENEKKSPLSPYGQTKLIFEHILEDFDKAYGLKSVCLRYFNAAGASLNGENGEDHNPETHLIPLTIKAAIDPKFSLKVFGKDYETRDGTCIRDYIHILDLADAHIKSLDYLLKNKKSAQFNLGSETGYSVMEIIEGVEKASGRKVKYRLGPRREGDPAVLVADSSKIKSQLDWNPHYSGLETIIKTAWNWHARPKKEAEKIDVLT